MSCYQYPALSSNSKSIRLVKLLASSDSTLDGKFSLSKINIQCELLLTNLNDGHRNYETVSYYWGDTIRKLEPIIRRKTSTSRDPDRMLYKFPRLESERSCVCQIHIDGMPFQVSIILLDLLCKLHNPKSDRILWIDFICIDQNNENEKTSQIRIMRDIFSNATRIVASLGPHRSYDDYLDPPLYTKLKVNAFYDGERALSIVSSWSKTLLSKITRSASDQKTILRLLEHPWFRRVWVIQEVAVARKLQIISRDASITGEDLAKFPKAFMHSRTSEELRDKISQLEPFFDYLQSTSLDSTRTELLVLLHRFRSWNASKPVDKVYALLGLASDDVETPELRIDYSIEKTPSVLYNRVARYMIRRYNSLAILTYTSALSNDQHSIIESPGVLSWLWTTFMSTTGIGTSDITPSWCPDWREEYTCPQIPEPVQRSRHNMHTDRFISRSSVYESSEDNILKVSGYPLARIFSFYHKKGGIEVELDERLQKLETQSSWWPWRPASDHLTKLPITLQKDDLLCILNGSTGLAILRPSGKYHRLVILQHSQFSSNAWTNRRDFLDRSALTIDDRVTRTKNLCKLAAQIFDTSFDETRFSSNRRSYAEDFHFDIFRATTFLLI